MDIADEGRPGHAPVDRPAQDDLSQDHG
jgi:hypothetical protein